MNEDDTQSLLFDDEIPPSCSEANPSETSYDDLFFADLEEEQTLWEPEEELMMFDSTVLSESEEEILFDEEGKCLSSPHLHTDQHQRVSQDR